MILERKSDFDLNEIKDLQILLEKNEKYAEVFNDSNKLDIIYNFISMRTKYSAAMKEINTKLEILDDEFNEIHQYNPIHHLESRVKSPRSILKKALEIKQDWNIDVIQSTINDIAGVRVICNYVNDIYRIEKLLVGQNDVHLIDRKDYIESPKKSGYRSLHLLVSVPVFLSDGTVEVPVEIQLRTIGMDMWASLEHKLRYKTTAKAIDGTINKKLEECAKDISRIDKDMEMIHSDLINKHQ